MKTLFEPEFLKRWTLPSCYCGEHWPEYYVFLGRSRDSSALEESNFRCGLKAIGGEKTADDESETPLVIIVRESHWAVGWVEWIAIHESATEQLKIADRIKGELGDYPVVDESDWSELEMEQADQVWKDCYRVKDRINYIREHRSQFEFRDFQDMLACVRGHYFAGYASELLN